MAIHRRFGRRQERLYLIGVPGWPNFGDDAIARGWLRWLARHRPDAEVWFDTPNASGATALHHGIHPRAVFVDTISRLGGWQLDGTPRDRAAAIEKILDDPGRMAQWVAGIDAFRSADRVHIVGGGYITGDEPWLTGLVGAARWAHRECGARVAATGLGMMPLTPDLVELWRESADAFSVITVRDEPTRVALGLEHKVQLAPDDIFLGGVAQHIHDCSTRRETIVLAQADRHDQFDLLQGQVARLLEHWHVEDGLRFVEANPPVDHRIFAALHERWPAATFVPFSQVMGGGLPVGPQQQWITTRYHPHLLAAARGARGVAVNVDDDYYGVKHRAVTRMGSSWPVVNLTDDPVSPGEAGDLPSRVLEHQSSLEQIAAQIYH